MAEAKKPSFPNKPCPKCKEPIHIRSQKHEKCGWVAKKKAAPAAAAKASPVAKKKPGRPAGSTKAAGSISLADIQAVKALTERIGADKVKELADVLA